MQFDCATDKYIAENLSCEFFRQFRHCFKRVNRSEDKHTCVLISWALTTAVLTDVAICRRCLLTYARRRVSLLNESTP